MRRAAGKTLLRWRCTGTCRRPALFVGQPREARACRGRPPPPQRRRGSRDGNPLRSALRIMPHYTQRQAVACTGEYRQHFALRCLFVQPPSCYPRSRFDITKLCQISVPAPAPLAPPTSRGRGLSPRPLARCRALRKRAADCAGTNRAAYLNTRPRRFSHRRRPATRTLGRAPVFSFSRIAAKMKNHGHACTVTPPNSRHGDFSARRSLRLG